MTNEGILLAIDCGTQSLRVLLFDTKGVLLAKGRERYKAYVSPRPGWAEQDAELFWRSLCACCQDMKKRFPAAFNNVCGIGVTA